MKQLAIAVLLLTVPVLALAQVGTATPKISDKLILRLRVEPANFGRSSERRFFRVGESSDMTLSLHRSGNQLVPYQFDPGKIECFTGTEPDPDCILFSYVPDALSFVQRTIRVFFKKSGNPIVIKATLRTQDGEVATRKIWITVVPK